MLLEVVNASFSYGNNVIFEDINLNIGRGEILCLLGPNGCGKTTLLDCIMGLLKPGSGKILLQGKDIRGLKPNEIARTISFVPQLHEKSFPFKVMDIVLMGRAAYTSIFSSPSKEDNKIAEEALRTVGMYDYKDRMYTQLSGGQGQLVMIARALAQQTPVVVLDEPTAHLDFKHELRILESIIDLVIETGISIIMATHFPNQAFYMENAGVMTKVAIMNEKNFAAFGCPSQVISEANFRNIFDIEAKIISYDLWEKESKKYIVPITTINRE